MPNVWLAATICNQDEADRDIPKLLQTPAAVRFLSMEPLLGPVNIEHWLSEMRCPDGFIRYAGEALDWIIVGGESNTGARPMHPDWVRSLRDQCAAAGVPFLFKQWGEWLPEDQPESGRFVVSDERPVHVWPDEWGSLRVGKKAAGRRLDGVLHDEFP